MRDFAASGTVVGYLLAAYFYAYALMQIPVGVLMDRCGPRRLLNAAALIAALDSAVFAASEVLLRASRGRSSSRWR
jgi:MFS family permease